MDLPEYKNKEKIALEINEYLQEVLSKRKETDYEDELINLGFGLASQHVLMYLTKELEKMAIKLK